MHGLGKKEKEITAGLNDEDEESSNAPANVGPASTPAL